MVSVKIFKQSKENNPGSLKYASYLLLRTKNFRRKTGKEKNLTWKANLKRKRSPNRQGSRPARPRSKGRWRQPGKLQCHLVAGDESAAVRARAESAAAPRSAYGEPGVPRHRSGQVRRTGPKPEGSLLSRARNFYDISRRVCDAPSPPQRRRHTEHSPLPGGATTPSPTPSLHPLLGDVRWAGERTPGTLGTAGTEGGALLAVHSKQRSLFSTVPARLSYRTPFPVPFKGPTLCGAALARKV